MASKIELYREVLEIEPNSKVFFPLARQLAGEGREGEAADVLFRGIAFHPDHLEAKFFLIELLSRLGRSGEADAVFADVGGLLARYPSVWLLWSRTAASRSKDPALAMLFLANYFQDESLTWAEVMERGLRSLRQAEPAVPVGTPVAVSTATAAAVEPVREAPAAPAVPQPAPAAETVSAPGEDSLSLRGAREVMELAADLAPAAPEPVDKGRGKAAKGRDAVVRTRTMAILLANQGDVAGAREIYDELLSHLPPGPEREEIAALMAGLDAGRVSGHDAAATAAPEPAAGDDDGPRKAPGPAKLVSLLEALAGRLDARARG
ncbi:tetratricopeptide repeat protein [Solidesulfovibrio sp.]|uniref:tetratricopeptide repeat protein n=1 Tax=Solidesulfovibrio sp. TaxID=2910990 RepID=UPI002637BF24|nr:tetratricopeptide repeat protein [Solidesulfovibrio sp.]